MKNLEGLYGVLAPGSKIVKMNLTTSTIKEPRSAVVTQKQRHSKIGTQQERQTPLKNYADRRGPRNSEKPLE